MKQVIEKDIAILGGGVAGLWLLNRLRQLSYSAVLLETNTLGSGQTHVSQGIIHGGMKYALQGAITAATRAIADMPQIWNDCLQGKGVIDLSHVPIFSEYQHLWSNNTFAAKLAGFFSGLVLQGDVKSLEKSQYPAIFQHSQFKGQLYSLKEPVIDANALVRELAKPYQEHIYKIDLLNAAQFHFNQQGELEAIDLHAASCEPIQLKARYFVFTAGNGNEALLQYLPNQEIKMQRRPLHMVVVKTEFPYLFYAHCLGLSASPRITITTHRAQDGKIVWYLGGQIAEEGVKRSSEEQASIARKELIELFPWLDFSKAQIATFFIDRAEALQADGKRPDSCYVKTFKNIIVGWPTKLAFAPKLAEEVIEKIQIQPSSSDASVLNNWPKPEVVKPIWDELLP